MYIFKYTFFQIINTFWLLFKSGVPLQAALFLYLLSFYLHKTLHEQVIVYSAEILIAYTSIFLHLILF